MTEYGVKNCPRHGEQSPCRINFGYRGKKYKFCIQCNREAGRRCYQKNAQKRIDYQHKYYSEHPEVFKAKNLKWRVANMERFRETQNRYRRENRDKYRAKERAQYFNNPQRFLDKYHRRRSVLKTGRVDYGEWMEVVSLYDSCCKYCGRDDRPLTQDHVIPLSKGGLHDISNLVPSCRNCNSAKGDRVGVAV